MSIQKILLIANLSHNFDGLKKISEQQEKNMTELFGSGNLPLGILSIEAYIRKACPTVETRLIDLNTQFLKAISTGDLDERLAEIVADFDSFLMADIGRTCAEYRPDLIVISTLFDKSIPTLLEMSQKIRALMPDVLIIAGGHPANSLYKEIIQAGEPAINAICLGEGEIPYEELIKSDSPAKHIQQSPYFVTVEDCKDTSIKSLKKASVPVLDHIPMFDYDRYFEQYGDDVLCLHNNVLDSKHSFNRQAVIMTSRGCPYQCIFCASQAIHGRKVRANSLERVKEEIDYWVEKHQVKTIGIMDDHFLFDVPRAIAICDYAGSKGLDIRFLNGLAIAPINQALVDCFVRNGIQEVHLALESGSDRVLKEIIKKPLSIRHAETVLEMFMKTDIFVKLYLVVGFPKETKADIEASLRFLRQANFHWALISPPTPISGSGLYQELLEEGLVDSYDISKVSFFDNAFENKALAKEMNGDIKYTVNLDINFVHNPYMRIGAYDLAKERFESLILNYPNHAFAIYYLVKCLEKLGHDETEIAMLKDRYNRLTKEDSKWQMYAGYFGLEQSL